MTLYKNINSIKMKTVGAVVFIHLLLLIAGVEPNPGPKDKLVLRYQYLLIEVGTELLRKLYDVKVSSYNGFYKDLKRLLATKILNDDQKNLLPPLNKNPNTASYDISLLTCLLRNVCGLKRHDDPVWINPTKTDFTVEAEITRLRECRNVVVHKSTVHMSESDFNQKWSEMRQILSRLNNFCNVPSLTKKIDDARSIPLDDELIQQHDNILKAWHEAESLFEKGIDHIKIGQSEIKGAVCDLNDGQSQLKDGQSQLKDGQSDLKDGQSELKDGQSELKDGQSELKHGQSELKDGQSELKDGQSQLKDGQSELKDGFENVDKNQKDQTKLLQNVQDVQEQNKRILDNIEQACTSNKRNKFFTDNDIKERLRKSYEKNFRTVCVTPLYSEDDRMDMLTVYARSEMKHVPYHRTKQNEDDLKISSYKQVFSKNNTFFRNIFITGDAGMGKTSFGQFMSLLWSKAIAGDIVGNTETQEDARFMTNFDFVFYISLKETNHEDVVSMIVDKYFFTSSKDKYEETIKTIEQLLQTKNCLVILDGLDEWRPDISGHRNPSLPRKVTSDCDRCTYLTTCRPHIIETHRLLEMDIDHQVQITGFDHEKYIREVIGYINESQNGNKDPDDFMRQIKDSEMNDQLHIPLITSQLIVVWFNYEMRNMNRAMIHGSIVDMLFARAIKNEIKFPSMTSSDVHLPKSLSRFTDLQKYVSTLEKVCMLSFLLMFDPNNKTPSLVFTNDQLSDSDNISPEEIDFLCQLGIISKNKVTAPFGKQKHMLSFLHTSYLEFLTAIFVSLYDKTNLFCQSVKKISFYNVGNYQNFLILLSGISQKKTRTFFEIIYMVHKEELDIQRSKLVLDLRSNLNSWQNIILYCLKEICVSDNLQIFIKLEDFNTEGYYDVDFNMKGYSKKRLKIIKELLVLNKDNVKSLITRGYQDEFSEIKGLQYLIIKEHFDVKFNDVMLHNQSTLHGLMLYCFTLLSEIPVRSLPFLTSVCFQGMTIKHDIVHDLMNYLSGNIQLENIVLHGVSCEEHGLCWSDKSKCQLTLNLSDNSKLLSVGLHNILMIECSGINTSCLTSLSLELELIEELMHVVNSIQNSKLKQLFINYDSIYNSDVKHVLNAVKSLKYLETLQLIGFSIQDTVPLQIHPDIVCDEYIDIKLQDVTMSDKCFQDFINCVVNHQSMVRVYIFNCVISRSNFDTWNLRIQRLKAIQNVRIIALPYVCNYSNYDGDGDNDYAMDANEVDDDEDDNNDNNSDDYDDDSNNVVNVDLDDQDDNDIDEKNTESVDDDYDDLDDNDIDERNSESVDDDYDDQDDYDIDEKNSESVDDDYIYSIVFLFETIKKPPG